MSAKKGFKIGEVCKLLDIQPYVLRYWETEFVALHPAKSQSGQRVYADAEVAVIRRIKELLYDEGYTIAGAKKQLESREAEVGNEGKVAAATHGLFDLDREPDANGSRAVRRGRSAGRHGATGKARSRLTPHLPTG